jgi:hypothetical protein
MYEEVGQKARCAGSWFVVGLYKLPSKERESHVFFANARPNSVA